MRIGTIGTGSIVKVFLSAVEEVDGAKGDAVYSRREENGRGLADKFGIKKVYTDLDAMLDDEDIDFIYVASPNSLHYEQSLRALESGKHVICEKPFTSTVDEIDELIKVAKEKKLMLFEAITTIYLPNYKLIKESVKRLGRIKLIQCNYSQYSSKYNKLLAGQTPNVFNPKFSGGALQDINIYNLHFVMNIFGSPQKVSYTANKHPNGIDTSGVLVLEYSDFICECVGAKDTTGMNFVLIQGEKGYLYVKKGANGCREFSLHIGDKEIRINEQEDNMNRLYHEILAFADIYNRGDFERCYELLDYSRSVMEVLVAARKDGGIVFEADLKR
ncbi:Gfo/Idh/MocA family protein [Halonatronum saccharophilum]|uniref:Gfo/Idh/MocA family protein n=1 Tax=Halonatronum saccharophilum TaxID=150060 RepID=UPI0004850BA8|nr:Gfo/Idh/MocA family oxidoreductase [Halonatronum saccharophilum]